MTVPIDRGGSRVLVAVRVAAAPARAFDAFTTEIARWWRPNSLFQFTLGRTDGTLVFEPGPHGRLLERYPDGGSFVIGQVRVWEPPRRLVLSWRQAGFAADHETELHVRFESVGDVPGTDGEAAEHAATRVVVEHFGWDRVPRDHVGRHGFPLEAIQRRYAEWWQLLLASFTATFR